MSIFNLYVKLRNFIINNFFVNILCFKKNNNFIYLHNPIYQYCLLLIPFYFVNLIAIKYKYDIIYKRDGIYGITNIKENMIIPFITNCIVIKDENILNISSNLRIYNSSIPLHFFINNDKLLMYDILKIIYLKKGDKIEKKIMLNEIDTKNYLIYNLFD